MTLSQFIDRVRSRHNADGDANWSDVELLGLLTDRMNEAALIIGYMSYEQSITTVADTQSYDLNSRVNEITRVRYDGFDLKGISDRENSHYSYQGTTPTGTPHSYYIFQGKIYLVPTPSEAKTVIVRFYGAHDELTSVSDIWSCPVPCQWAMINGVVADMFDKDLNPQMSNVYEDRWINKSIPAIQAYRRNIETSGGFTVTVDSDISLQTELGVV